MPRVRRRRLDALPLYPHRLIKGLGCSLFERRAGAPIATWRAAGASVLHIGVDYSRNMYTLEPSHICELPMYTRKLCLCDVTSRPNLDLVRA